MALSIGFRILSFLPSCYSSYGALNSYPDGTFTHCSCQPSLDAHFSGTTGLSDFPDPFVIGVRPWTSRRVPRQLRPWADLGSPGSHARCLRTCSGSLTARDSGAPRDIGVPD